VLPTLARVGHPGPSASYGYGYSCRYKYSHGYGSSCKYSYCYCYCYSCKYSYCYRYGRAPAPSHRCPAKRISMSITFSAGGCNWPTSQPTLAPQPATRNEPVLVADPAAAESITITHREPGNSTAWGLSWGSGDPGNSGAPLTGSLLSTGYAVAVTAGGPVLSTLLSIQAGAGYSYAIDYPGQDGGP
jgi:hypothetical protein